MNISVGTELPHCRSPLQAGLVFYVAAAASANVSAGAQPKLSLESRERLS